MDLTQEQIAAAETMPLSELRALAMKEAEAAVATVPPVAAAAEPKADTRPEAVGQARDAQGRFTNADQIDNSDDQANDAEADAAPAKTIYRKEIANGDGSVDVYEADTLEDLVEKLAVGKLNANKKIQEFISEKKAAAVQSAQITADEEYVVAERMKKNPKQTMKEIVAEVIDERLNREQRSKDVQSHFVNTHPDYIADPTSGNGDRMVAEFRRLYPQATEFTRDGLEKAYQELKKSGLLKLKSLGADGVAEEKTKEPEQTVQPSADATQQRSQRTSSTISTRNSRTASAVTSAQPTEDELYSMPLDKLKDLANAQLAKANAQE